MDGVRSNVVAARAASSTSPRLRGEVGLRASSARNPGEGDPRQTECQESPPHPDPLPASGERELTEIAAPSVNQFARKATVTMNPPPTNDPLNPFVRVGSPSIKPALQNLNTHRIICAHPRAAAKSATG